MKYSEQISNRICQNPECNNYLLNRQLKYCSRKCSSTSPIRKVACSNSLKLRWKNDAEYKIRRRERAKEGSIKLWSNPEYKIKMKKLSSERLKNQWKDSIFRENQLIRSKKLFALYKEKAIQNTKNKWRNDPEFRKMMRTQASNHLKERWKNDEKFRLKISYKAKTTLNGGYNLLERYKRYGIEKCYLYLITFNNKFFKVGVSKTKKRPRLFIEDNMSYNPKLLILKENTIEKICNCEKYIHNNLHLPNYLQDIIVSGKSEVYDIKYLDKVLNVINKLN